MKTFTMCITAKKQELLYNFLKFLSTNMGSSFNSTKKNFFEKNSQIIISVLKSPHVNKTAQEQFKLPNYKTQLRVQITSSSTFFFFIKQLNHHTHPEIRVVITADEIENHKYLSFNSHLFDIDIFQIKSSNYPKDALLIKNPTTQTTRIQKNNTSSKTLFLVELLDIYGKIEMTFQV